VNEQRKQSINQSIISFITQLTNRNTSTDMIPPSNPAHYTFNLRPRGHDLSLPSVKKVLFNNSFIMRALFKYK